MSRPAGQHPARPRPEAALGLAMAMAMAMALLAGCATTPPPPPLTGDPIVDGENALRAGPTRDRVLWQYRAGLAALRQGRLDLARTHFEDAVTRLNGLYGKDSAAQKSRRLFTAEARKTFVGEPYERVMAWYYRGILYWMDGEPDNARACFRTGQLMDADAEVQGYKADYVLLDYLDGYITQKLGGDGREALQRAAGLARQWKMPDFPTNANVLVFVEYGLGPVKYATGEYRQELRFRDRPAPAVNARVRLSGGTGKAVPYDDLYFQATTRGGRLMDHVLGNKAVFKKTTEGLGTAALMSGAILSTRRDTEVAGLATMGAGLMATLLSAAANPAADTRTWDNLPHYLSFVAFEAPPGPHTLTVEFLDGQGRPLAGQDRTVSFSVPAHGRDQVLFVSDRSPQSPSP
ncbi:MAG: hypothetical protein RJA22_358 [Verrucomicrobiota bacterium]